MEYALLGWPPDGPTLDLDHEVFSYAGKFVMSNSGKAVVHQRDGGDPVVVAAASFNADRADPDVLRLRYVTVRRDRRGEGIGPRLCAFAADRARGRGYDLVRIGVNNPFAYHALWKAGFGYTGETTGLAELVLERPGERTREAYQAGLDAYRERDLSAVEREFLAAKADRDPPSVVGDDGWRAP